MNTALLTPIQDPSSPVGYGVANRFMNRECMNELFDSFDSSLQDRLRPFCDRVALKPGELLFNEQTPLHHAYFPESGAIALMGSLTTGQTVQVGFVDRQGVAGLPPPTGAVRTPRFEYVMAFAPPTAVPSI